MLKLIILYDFKYDIFILSHLELNCMNGVWRDIERERITCNCPELCNDNEYFQSVSASDWPGSGLISVLTQSYTGRSASLDFALSQRNGLYIIIVNLEILLLALHMCFFLFVTFLRPLQAQLHALNKLTLSSIQSIVLSVSSDLEFNWPRAIPKNVVMFSL